MKRIKEFFNKLICNKILVLPVVVGLVFLVVATFAVFKTSEKTPNIDGNLPAGMEGSLGYLQASDDLVFELYSSGYMIKGLKSGAKLESGYMILPETFNGKKVLKIKDGAFKGNTEIKGVVIPASVREVGEKAFFGCTELKTATFLSSESASENAVIGKSAFEGCVNLSEVTLGNSVKSVLENAFFSTDIETLFVASKSIYSQILTRNALQGALKNSPVILTFGEDKNGENIDDGSNDYLNNFYNLGSRTISDKSYTEYTLKGEISIINLDGNGATTLPRTEIEFLKEVQEDGSVRIVVLDENGKLVVGEDGLIPESVDIPRAYKLGYWFSGWEDSSKEKISKIDGTISDITLSATYSPRLIYITYELNGGANDDKNLGYKDGNSTESLAYTAYSSSGSGANVRVLYDPSKEHNMFNGWFIESDFKTKVNQIDVNIFNYITYEDENSDTMDTTAKTITLYAKFDTYLLFDSSGVITGINPAVGSVRELIIPATVDGVNLTTINEGAFENEKSLRTVTIGTSITTIGANAFKNCTYLQTVNVSGSAIRNIGNYAFLNCSSLKTFDIVESVQNLGVGAFKNCTKLQKVEFLGTPFVSNEIPDELFSGCTSLTEINLPKSITAIGENAFLNCKNLVLDLEKFTELKNLGKFALSGTGLKTVSLTSKQTEIGEGAFSNCVNLESVTIANDFGIKNLPNKLFSGCTKLSSIKFNSLINEIGEEAFYNCTSLASLTLGENVTKISKKAFANTLIKELSLPLSSTQILEGAFEGSKLISVNSENSNGWWSGEEFILIENAYSFATILKSGTELCYFEPFVYSETEKFVIGLTKEGKNQPYIILPMNITGVKLGAFNDAKVTQEVSLESPSSWFVMQTENLTPTFVQLDEFMKNNGFDLLKVIADYGLTQKDLFKIENGRLVGFSEFAKSVKQIIIPEGVEAIMPGAFSELESIEKIVLPKSLMLISGNCFGSNNTGKIVEIEFLDDTYWYTGEDADRTDVDFSVVYENANKLRENKTYQKIEVFKVVGETIIGLTDNGKNVEKLIIPSFIKYIEEYAFKGSIATSVIIPSSVKEIGRSAFENLVNVETLTFGLGSELKKVGAYAFAGMEKLKSIEFNAETITFGEGVFKNCLSLEKVVLPNSTTEIVQQMFANCIKLSEIEGITKITKIQSSAFMYCSSLTAITFPESLTTIGDNAFRECVKLKNITFSEGLQTIGNDVFRGCVGLEGSLTLPASVETLGGYCFSGCTNLSEIVFKDGTNIQTIGKGVFEGSGVTRILLPEGIKFKLKSSGGTVYGTITINNETNIAYDINKGRYKDYILIRVN